VRKHWLFIGITIMAAVLALGAIACGDDDEDDGDGITAPTATVSEAEPTEPADGETPAADETPEVSASVEIVAPEEASTGGSPVTLEVSASGVEIAPAADAVEGAAHYHAFVDLPAVAVGDAVPQDTAGVFHFGSDALDLELEPGEHTVTVVLGDNTHTRLDVPEATVTFTVE